MQRRFRNLPVVSAALVAINVIVFLVCMFSGERLYDLGGLCKDCIVDMGEYGRVFWSMFLHDDTAHLFNNMIILFFLGSMLEKQVGHIWFAVIYFLSGIGGNLASLFVKIATDSDSISIGASGAVFGLDGLLLAMVLCSRRFRNMIPPERVVLVVVLSLYDGFTNSNIDNAAHLGGLVVGFVIGFIVCIMQKNNKQYRREVQI